MNSSETPVALERVLAGAVAAVEAEGARLLAEFLSPEGPRGEGTKAPIDDEMEERLRAALTALVPCDFLGEETGFSPGRVEGWLWLIDPHDGTRDFLRGYRGSSVSVALLRGARPVLGIVHSPYSPDRGFDTFTWAEGCGPIRRNGAPVRVDLSGERLRAGALVWASRSASRRPVTYSRAAAPARYIGLTSIAHRLARVASGDGVAVTSVHPLNEYDIAAGAALIYAAGGVVLDAEGREVVFTGRPGALVSGCFAGAPQAAQQLAVFDWSALHTEPRSALRTPAVFPKRANEARLARAQGCLLGQVIGDSLGSLVEFKSAAEIARRYPGGVRELADGGTWGTIAGQATDDSELALALARSIVSEGGFDREAVRAAYRAWLASGPFDCGRTTRQGLAGTPSGESQANGALMRVSPIGIWSAGDPARAARAAREDAALTHPHPVCAEACAGYAAAIAVGIATGERAAMVDAALAHATGPARDAIERGARGEPPKEFATSQGWVLIALQNAFCQLVHATSFEQALVATVGAGGDTDTNAAIAGALLGALAGRDGVPARWTATILGARALREGGASRPRPATFWADDLLELAEALLI